MALRFLLLGMLLAGVTAGRAVSYDDDVRPLMQRYCIECHGGKKVKGKVDFTKMQTDADRTAAFETWEAAIELMRDGEMPPDAARQPSAAELETIYAWYQERFVNSVEAHPGYFRPRRLSAREYRNTVRDLFGFDLETAVIAAEQTQVEKSLVMKLLPTDPPGKSGFKNDTHGNPLTTVIWDQYSYLADQAIGRLFAGAHRKRLETLAGPIPQTGFDAGNAETLLRGFLPRVRRRPVSETVLSEIIARLRNAPDPAAAVVQELKTALMSPVFLYRGMLMGGVKDVQRPVDESELAERLSYFLWGTMPDRRLAQLAVDGKLVASLRAETDRLLESPKARDFVADFAIQWLALDAMDEFAKRQVPLAVALKTQPIEFMHHLVVENRPLLELLDSRTTFANPHLAKFYREERKQLRGYRKQKGIELEIVPHTRITLTETSERGGLLTMPGILAMNRGPVQRGAWMLERILGVHLPDPPPDVGQVEPNRAGENLTFRQRFEAHRSKPTCAVCHDKIDPLGFALQAYDREGAFAAAGGVDTTGRLPTGEAFTDFAGLKRILTTSRREAIVGNLVKKMLAYALCRKLEIHDQPTVEAITRRLTPENATWRDLIHAVVNSLPFRETVVKGPRS